MRSRRSTTLRDLPVELDIVGDGFDREECERLTRRLGLTDRVHFAGSQSRDQVEEFYDARGRLRLPQLPRTRGQRRFRGNGPRPADHRVRPGRPRQRGDARLRNRRSSRRSPSSWPRTSPTPYDDSPPTRTNCAASAGVHSTGSARSVSGAARWTASSTFTRRSSPGGGDARLGVAGLTRSPRRPAASSGQEPHGGRTGLDISRDEPIQHRRRARCLYWRTSSRSEASVRQYSTTRSASDAPPAAGRRPCRARAALPYPPPCGGSETTVGPGSRVRVGRRPGEAGVRPAAGLPASGPAGAGCGSGTSSPPVRAGRRAPRSAMNRGSSIGFSESRSTQVDVVVAPAQRCMRCQR